MKYKSFVKIRAVAILVLVVAAFYGVFHGCASRKEAVSTPPSVPVVAQGGDTSVAPPPTEGGQPAPAPDSPDLTDLQKKIMELQGQPLSNGTQAGDSIKWVVKDPSFRAEFRSDTAKGSHYWNRVKIDTNNNKKFEETWDFKPDGSIKRRVSPNDDGNYTETFQLKDGKWVPKG